MSLLGNGDGTFASAVMFQTAVVDVGSADGLCMIDVNGDQQIDIVVDRNVGLNNQLQTFLGNGDGSLQAATILAPPARNLYIFTAADFNNDGRVDFETVDSANSTSIRLFQGAVAPLLTVSQKTAGDFIQGQAEALTITVSNSPLGASTNAPVSVTEYVSGNLTFVSMSGSGWSCSGTSCSRIDSLAPGSSYPPITVSLSVSGSAQAAPYVLVTGGGSGTAEGLSSISILPPNAGAAHPISVAPNVGSGGREVFTFVASDANGAANIQYTQFLFANAGLGVYATNACYVSYDPIGNVFYLLSDDTTSWYGLLAGSGNTIGNAQCEIHGATSGASVTGNNLSVRIDLSFRSGFAGPKYTYQYSGDLSGIGSGWTQVGTWFAMADLDVIEVTSLSPLPGSGLSQTLTATITDNRTPGFVQFVMNTGLNGINACFIHYDPAANVFYLLNDSGTGWLGLVAGSATQVSNSQCTLAGAGSGGLASGNTLTVTYEFNFSGGFAGAKQIYMQAADIYGNIEVWHNEGTDTP